jgi:metal-sulfur cluster biosynthetic enzyme
MATTEGVFERISEVYDPAVLVNIVGLGLIYEVLVEERTAKVKMTLASQTCPEAPHIPDMLRRRVNTLEDIDGTEVEIVWEPTWTPQRISPAGREALGLDPEE